MPAASKIDASRYEVVVLPLVPVMPTSTRSSLGLPKNAADSAASASRASETCSHGTPRAVPAGRRFGDDGNRAARDRVAGERGAVGLETLAARRTPSRGRPRANRWSPTRRSSTQARRAIGVPACASNGARPAVACRRSPSVTAALQCAAAAARPSFSAHAVPGTATLPAAGDCSRTKPSPLSRPVMPRRVRRTNGVARAQPAQVGHHAVVARAWSAVEIDADASRRCGPRRRRRIRRRRRAPAARRSPSAQCRDGAATLRRCA